MSKLKTFLILGLIILLGTFLRFYKILEYPVQLNHDEITQLYDAWSVASTGKDIYGNFLPFIFSSINDHKPPYYTYVTGLFYFLIGPEEITIKLPGLIGGILAIPVIYFFTLQLLKNKYVALIAAFFTAIAPFELFYSRKSFENPTGVMLTMLGFGLLLKYLNQNKKDKNYLYSGMGILGFSMYVYFSQAVIIPLILLVFVIIYKKAFLSKPVIRPFLASLIIWFLIALPLFYVILTISDTRARSKDVFLTQDQGLSRQLENLNENNPQNFILRNYLTINYGLTRYLHQFDPEYLFFNGLEFTRSRIIDSGPLYLFQLPLVLLGIFYLTNHKKNNSEKLFMLMWILIGFIPSGTTFEPYSPHRVIMVFTMLNIICAAGLFYLFKFIEIPLKKPFFKGFVFCTLTLTISVSIVYYWHLYSVNNPHERSQYIHYPFKQVALFAASQKDNYNQIVFDPLFGEYAPEIGTAAHYYLGYYGGIHPEVMQKEYRIGNKDKREVLFDKYVVREVNWWEDQNLKNTLVIASKWSLFKDTIQKDNIVKVFYFYNGEPAFYAIKL